MKGNIDIIHLDVLFEIYRAAITLFKTPPAASFCTLFFHGATLPLTAHTWSTSVNFIYLFFLQLDECSYYLVLLHSILVLHRVPFWESVFHICNLISSSFFKFQTPFPSPCSQWMTLLYYWKKSNQIGLAVFYATKLYIHQYSAFPPFQINDTCFVPKLRSPLVQWIPFSLV